MLNLQDRQDLVPIGDNVTVKLEFFQHSLHHNLVHFIIFCHQDPGSSFDFWKRGGGSLEEFRRKKRDFRIKAASKAIDKFSGNDDDDDKLNSAIEKGKGEREKNLSKIGIETIPSTISLLNSTGVVHRTMAILLVAPGILE